MKSSVRLAKGIVLFLAFFFIPLRLQAQLFADGSGTPGNPFQIATAQHLANLATLVNADDLNYNSRDTHYKLTADINLAAYTAGKGWTPIGHSADAPFLAQFDGNYRTITNLAINNPSDGYDATGLFGWVYSVASVKNLRITNATVVGKDHTGGLAGRAGELTGIIPASVNNC